MRTLVREGGKSVDTDFGFVPSSKHRLKDGISVNLLWNLLFNNLPLQVVQPTMLSTLLLGSLPNLETSLIGTWTLQTHASSDLGYYKASAFVVMHVMDDPLHAYSCHLNDCHELENKICQQGQCVDMGDTILEWSDDAGYAWKTHVVQNTSDWIGPYNLVLPQTNLTMESRYVATAATDYLQAPQNCTIVSKQLYDEYAGATAVRNTIRQQTKLGPSQDPYAAQHATCDNGDIQPTLPRMVLSNQSLQLDFAMLSLPDAKKDATLYKLWPTLQKHLPDFPVVGPYCFGGDSHRAYAISTFDDSMANNTWRLTKGCVAGLPCWPNEHVPDPPHPDGGKGKPSRSQMIVSALLAYGSYALLLVLIISLTCNCQQSYQLQRLLEQQPSHGPPNGAPHSSNEVNPDLEEPLLQPNDESTESNPADTELSTPTEPCGPSE